MSALMLAFFLSACCFVIAFAMNDIGLFGEKTILISDMKKQYIAFYQALREGRFHAYSFEIGLGAPTVALFAYYLSSPFSLLIYLFPADKLPTAMFFIILMKVACSSVTFSYHLMKKEKMEPIRTVPFGLCYSLMSFVFFYFINQFWLDALIWLPLLLLSLEDVIEEKKIAKTTAILAILFISNYYISYMTGMFTAFYLVYLCFIRGKAVRESIYSLLRLAGSAILAFCCAGALMLPTLYQMAGSLGDAYDGYGIVNYTPKQMILKLFIGYFDSIGNAAAPTIFCGTFVLILTVMYFLNKEIPIRERAAGGVFLLFMMISTYLPFLDKIWHGFAYPNAFAYRYAFCISYLLVSFAAQAYERAEGMQKSVLIGTLAVPALLLIFSTKVLRNTSLYTLVAEVFFCIVYPCCLLVIKGKGNKKVFSHLIILAVCAEMSLNGALVLKGVDAQNEFPQYSQYTDFHRMMAEALEDTDPLSRVAYIDSERLNAGMEIGFLSPSLFSSAYDPAAADAVGKMGYSIASKQYQYAAGYEETDRLLGIRYRMTAEKSGEGESPVITEITKEDLGKVCPLAFYIPAEMVEVQLGGDPESNRGLIRNFMESSGWKDVPLTDIRIEGSTLSGNIDMPKEGAVWFSIPCQNGWKAFVDGEEAPVMVTLDRFISVPVSNGAHTVKLIYRVPYQTAGIALSVLGWALLCCIRAVEKKRAAI